ncbi:MAG: sigma-70 family RNA polymerase sigma factor [Elusimicrobia bacterium]|nr:sigma-70 family RNA polymerase sigma factor [Elusimicrobiota bacterium]
MNKMRAEEFAGLLRQTGDKAYNFAYRLAGNEQDARDLVQEAFARALEHSGSYDRARAFDSWLLRILHNVFLDGVRRLAHRSTVSLDAPAPVEDGSWNDVLHAADLTAPDELIRRESIDMVQLALERLPAHYKAAIVLCDVEGMSYDEIARIMDVPVGTVRSRIHQGRLLARQAYEELEKRGGRRS